MANKQENKKPKTLSEKIKIALWYIEMFETAQEAESIFKIAFDTYIKASASVKDQPKELSLAQKLEQQKIENNLANI